MKCEEDDEFIAELERTMTSELTGRKMDSTVNKVNSSDLALPMNRGFKGMCLSLSIRCLSGFSFSLQPSMHVFCSAIL